jgi:tRNA 2-thiouridine synthesizing protein E
VRKLFPSGYLRGLCKLAGVTYREAYLQSLYLERHSLRIDHVYEHKVYGVDAGWFLTDFACWDENFALHRAYDLKYPDVLLERHFVILRHLRDRFERSHLIPDFEAVNEQLNLEAGEFDGLFPNGYYFGACRLAGLPYRDNFGPCPGTEAAEAEAGSAAFRRDYHIDIRGFMVNPAEWNRYYAARRAADMGMAENGLTDAHWAFLEYLRNRFKLRRKVPTVYEACKANDLDLAGFNRLFPGGFHRGAVKLAGLRVR